MKDNDFVQINGKDFAIGIDFGSKSDIAVETICRFEEGKLKIESSSIIGHSRDFNTEEKRNKYLERYENSK